jgi:hypothetical protein
VLFVTSKEKKDKMQDNQDKEINMDGVQNTRKYRFSAFFQTGPVAHPASHTMRSESLSLE